jgi:NADPH:quinone reductase-like Zn-dependent oxidoreductase
MNAAVCRRYGPPDSVTIEAVETPAPGPRDVLIRVRATTVSSADWRIRSLAMPYGFAAFGRIAFGLRAPRQPILGSELSGDVVAAGSAVRRFAPGDAVIAFPGSKLGAHAEDCCVPEDGMIVKKPPHLAYEHAAALAFAGTTALDFFRRARLRAGDHVLINGASGAVGSAMVQLAVDAGARVSAVCSTGNASLVSTLGASRVIDYARTDFAGEGIRYDVIVDTVGNAPYARAKRALNKGGRLLLVLATLPELLRAPWITLTTGHRVIAGPAAERMADLRTIVQMAESGRFTPVIDSCRPFSEIVHAHARVESGRKRGAVVVQFDALPPSLAR